MDEQQKKELDMNQQPEHESSEVTSSPEPTSEVPAETPSQPAAPATPTPAAPAATPASAPTPQAPSAAAPTSTSAQAPKAAPTQALTKPATPTTPVPSDSISLGGVVIKKMMLYYAGAALGALLIILFLFSMIAPLLSGGPADTGSGQFVKPSEPAMVLRSKNPRTGTFSPIVDALDVTAPVEIQFDTRLTLVKATPEYRITSYEWDLNGDGRFTAAEGNSAVATYQYLDAGLNNGLFEGGVRIQKEILTAHDGYKAGEVVTEEYGPGADQGGFTIKITSEKPFIDVRTAPTDLEGLAPFEVDFDASRSTSKAGIYEIRWDFDGDNIPDEIGDKVTYSFTNPGINDVTVIVEDEEGKISTERFEVEVLEVIKPEPVIDADVLAGDAPLEIDFSGANSTASDGNITKYTWDFGDDSPVSTSREVTHTFEKPGRYIVTLTVETDLGSTGEVQQVIEVSTALSSPTARISAEGEGSDLKTSEGTQGQTIRGKIPFKVDLNGAVSTDPEDDIISWKWDLDGDETFDTSGDAVFNEYKIPGTYLVTLEVEDSVGNIATASLTVIAEADDFVVDIVADPISGVAPRFVAFDATASSYTRGDIVSYEWDFGDGSPKQFTGGIVTHEYLNPGRYTVSLKVGAEDGTTKEGRIFITMLQEQLEAIFSASPESGTSPLDVNFDASDSVGSIVSYRWDFGDGTTATGATVAHTFQQPGRYNVELVVQDTFGGAKRITKEIRVLAQ